MTTASRSVLGGKVFLDEIRYFNFDPENQLVAFAGGDVDAIYSFGHEQLAFAEALDGQILPARTAQTLACRMQVDVAPFDNLKVRQAMQLSLDRARIRELVFGEAGDVGDDYHVAPVHPEWFPLPPLERDIDAAKALLARPATPTSTSPIDVGNTNGVWQQSTSCRPRVFGRRRDAVRHHLLDPPPLGTMVLSVGYRAGVPWNESHYNNPEFEAALDAAEAVLDVEKRKALMERVEQIMRDDAFLILPVWQPVYTIAKTTVHGYPPHPTNYHQFNKVWIG